MQPQENLMEALASPENLLTAWRSVRGNIPRYRRQRSAGPDGVTLAEFERDLPAQLSALRHVLLKGRYQPQRPGLFTVQKRSGGTRQIALLNVADRVAQRAAQQAIEPIYEPGFLPCSFGFRPGRSIQDAVYCARRLRGHGYAWVVDGDIASCFDSLDHGLLMQRIGKTIRDKRVLDLLEKWLVIGVLENGLPPEQHDWMAQGWQKACGGLRRGFGWALSTFSRQGPAFDPYASARYEESPYSAGGTDFQDEGELSPGFDADDETIYSRPMGDELERQAVQQRAIQQMAAGGLLMGTSWARARPGKSSSGSHWRAKKPSWTASLKTWLIGRWRRGGGGRGRGCNRLFSLSSGGSSARGNLAG